MAVANAQGSAVRLGVYQSGIGWSFEELRDVWVEADRFGFDSVHMMDNVVGPVPREPELPVFETFTVLPALAEATERIRFGPMVTPSGRRHPALFAKMTSVLDVISGGRFILAMGCGDEPRHFVPWGMAYPKTSERIAIMVEEIEILKRMWTDDHAYFEGQHYHLDGAVNYPKPLQAPRPPIWVGLNLGRKLMPRVAARDADGFNIYIGPDEAARELCDIVRRFAAEEGRDYDLLDRSRHLLITFTEDDIDFNQLIRDQARSMKLEEQYLRDHYAKYVRLIWGPPERVAEQLEEQLAIGFNYLLLQFQGAQDSSLGGDAPSALAGVRKFANEVAPRLRGSATQTPGGGA